MDDVINAFLHLLYDTERCLRASPGYCRSEALPNFLRDFRLNRINPLHRRLSVLDVRRYVLSIVGLTNVGKSTLAHALLEHPVAPVQNGPATSIPVEYEYGTDWLLKIVSSETSSVQNVRYDSPDQLTSALKRVIFHEQGETANGIERVLVRGPMGLLKDGIVLADTPGYGAAQIDEAGGTHPARLVTYLRDNVHEVCFCVSGANCMVRKEEVEFFKSIRESCSTVVVTKWDAEPDERESEMGRYKQRFANLLPMCQSMFVEAKWAIEALASGHAGKLEASQVEGLRSLIRLQVSPADRLVALRQQIKDAWEDIFEVARQPLREAGIATIPWREDALLRFRQAAKKHDFSFRETP